MEFYFKTLQTAEKFVSIFLLKKEQDFLVEYEPESNLLHCAQRDEKGTYNLIYTIEIETGNILEIKGKKG